MNPLYPTASRFRGNILRVLCEFIAGIALSA
jgi:hypothetical protein